MASKLTKANKQSVLSKPSITTLLFVVGMLFTTLFSSAQDPPASTADPKLPATVQRLNATPGIENLFQVTANIYSGGEPTEAGFQKLKELGITTIVSVDGLPPNISMAEKFGLRYFHIPMGYDQIEHAQFQDFVTLMNNEKGKIYIHCHHGKHRGPAAVAACLRISGEFTHQQALAFMRLAGTGKEYRGLWESIEKLQPGSYKVGDLEDIPALSPQRDIAQEMAELDRAWEVLVAQNKQAETRLDLAQIVIVKESFRESLRFAKTSKAGTFGTTDQTSEFLKLLEQSLADTAALESAVTSNENEKARLLMNNLAKQCADCHSNYRNGN